MHRRCSGAPITKVRRTKTTDLASNDRGIVRGLTVLAQQVLTDAARVAIHRLLGGLMVSLLDLIQRWLRTRTGCLCAAILLWVLSLLAVMLTLLFAGRLADWVRYL